MPGQPCHRLSHGRVRPRTTPLSARHISSRPQTLRPQTRAAIGPVRRTPHHPRHRHPRSSLHRSPGCNRTRPAGPDPCTVPDCPSLPALLERLAKVTNLQVSTPSCRQRRRRHTFGMAGSPTLLTAGRPRPPRTSQRLRPVKYWVPGGPALCRSTRSRRPLSRPSCGPSPLPTSTRSAPTPAVAPASYGRRCADAIRLGPDGAIALAYPFSANPTRYRVRIDDQVDVFAMRAGDGPSADCCCD